MRLPRSSMSRVGLGVLLLALLVSSIPALAATPAHKARTHHRRHHKRRRRAHRARHAHSRAVRIGAAGSTSPSGVPMPAGDIPGWHQVLADDFTGTTLDLSRWFAYQGQPGGDPGGWWDPSHVSVSGGALVLAGYRDSRFGNRWVTGGVSSRPGLIQTYGKYLVRFRFDAGVGIAHAILLWPADNSWPPEVDFSEDNGANKQTTYATLHWGATNNQLQVQTAVNLTLWHTLGVEWTPGRLVYTLDGQVWRTVHSIDTPSIPMVMDIQTQAWGCNVNPWENCPNSTTPPHVNLYVDWAVAYSPA